MNSITFDEFQKTTEYQNFKRENPSVGSLRVNVFAANVAIPLENVNIVITKKVGNYQVLFFDGFTDSSGIIDNIVLPAPDISSNNMEVPGYTFYDLNASREGYQEVEQYEIAMFGNTKVIQYVKLMPEVNNNV